MTTLSILAQASEPITRGDVGFAALILFGLIAGLGICFLVLKFFANMNHPTGGR